MPHALFFYKMKLSGLSIGNAVHTIIRCVIRFTYGLNSKSISWKEKSNDSSSAQELLEVKKKHITSSNPSSEALLSMALAHHLVCLGSAALTAPFCGLQH